MVVIFSLLARRKLPPNRAVAFIILTRALLCGLLTLPQCTTAACAAGWYESEPCTAYSATYAYWYYMDKGGFPAEADRVCSKVRFSQRANLIRQRQRVAPHAVPADAERRVCLQCASGCATCTAVYTSSTVDASLLRSPKLADYRRGSLPYQSTCTACQDGYYLKDAGGGVFVCDTVRALRCWGSGKNVESMCSGR